MPRRQYPSSGGLVFHVWNRAIRRETLFHTPDDYLAFIRVIVEGQSKVDMRLLEWCLMRNHFHLLVWPRADVDLARFLYVITQLHACRWSRFHGTRGTGPVYQGRFNARPVESGFDFLTAACYVLRNPVEKHLVTRVEDWPWSSASTAALPEPRPALHDWPLPKPANWSDTLHLRTKPARARELQRSLVANAAAPASDEWRNATAALQVWTAGRRRPGRPRKVNESGTGFPSPASSSGARACANERE